MKLSHMLFLAVLCAALSCVCKAESTPTEPALNLSSADNTVSLDAAQTFETIPDSPTILEIKTNRVELVDAVAGEKYQVGFATVIGAAVILALLIW